MPLPNADGPDLSHWNVLTGEPRDPRWTIFSHKVSEGKTGRDPMLRERWEWAEDQGFKHRGGYHWLRSDSTVKDQAANLVAGIMSVGGFVPGVFAQIDWETTKGIPLPTSGMAAEMADRVNQAAGREAAITYLGTWLPDSPLDADVIGEAIEWRSENPTAPLWIAFYNTAAGGGWKACADWDADLWQWTSNYQHPSIITPKADGTVRGFDMNHVFRWSVLDAACGIRSEPAPEPEEDEMRRVIVQDQRLGGAAYFADTLVPVGAEVLKAVQADPDVVVIPQDHEHTTAAFLHRNGSEASRLYERFRDSRDNVAD